MPKYSGNIWNVSACNRLVAERMENNRHDKHLRAIEGTRGIVDHHAPKEHKHLQNKLKTKKLQEDRAAEIQLENRILLQKMLSIDTKPTDLSSEALVNQRVPPRSLTGNVQRRELDRITGANQQLLKRLQTTKGTYDPRTWEDEEVDRQALKFRLSQNACRGRATKLRMPDRPQASERLPRIPGLQYGNEDWTSLSDAELDHRLRLIERGGASSSGPPALGNA